MDTIKEFLKGREKRTQHNYGWILNQYFTEIKQNPNTYLSKKRDFQQDITEWWNQHIDEVPKTRNTKLSILHSYFEHYEKTFPKKFWLGLRRKKKGSRAATLDRVPKPTEFKNMLLHGDIKDKALFLVLSSSGMRIDECLKITLPMIDLKHDPVLIKLPGTITKTGDPRITFISNEAKYYLLEWLKIREKYIKTAIDKTKHLCDKKKEDNRVFPFSYDVARTRWDYLLKRTDLAEKDPTTNRYIIHIHCLRKFFLSQMKLEVPAVIPEALAGHEEYLDESYRRFTQEQLAEYYKKAESKLTILETPPDYSDVKKEIDDLKEQIRKKDKELEKRMTEVIEYRLQLLEEKDHNGKLQKILTKKRDFQQDITEWW
ncbi:MAG: tyrosine-type recombinase/integrase, partial [Magnetococcus sp. YQC-3]